MRVRLRVSICSDCGTLLLRSPPSPGNVRQPRTSQFESRRPIAWKSLFGLVGSQSKPTATAKPPPPPDEKSRKRAEAIARRLREARDARRPIDVSTQDNPPPKEPIPPAPPPPPNIRQTTPSTTPSSPPTRTFIPEKQDGRRAKLKQALSDYNEPLPAQKPGSFLFSKPLREEQNAALKGYLNMATPQKPKRQAAREKYPWEEEPLPPLPWEKQRTPQINHVRELVHPLEADLAKEKELRKRIPRISRVEVPDTPPPGKLYKTLRLHHDIVQKARTTGNEGLVVKANQELERQLVSSTQALAKGERDLIAFRNLLKPSAKEGLPPLVMFLLARDGFDPTRGYRLADKLPESDTARDKFGRLTGSLLDEMTWNYYHAKLFRGNSIGIESFACKKTLSQPFIPRPAMSHNFHLVQHQVLVPRSELTFDREGIIISIPDASIIWRSKETIQLWHQDKQLRLSEVNKGGFLSELERMKHSCTVWAKGARAFQDIYDY